MRYALGGGGGVTVGMSVGTGSWDNGWGGWGNGSSGVGVGMTAVTRLPPSQGMAQVYNQCVQRRTGQPPATPFNRRPEVQG